MSSAHNSMVECEEEEEEESSFDVHISYLFSLQLVAGALLLGWYQDV